MTFLIVLGGTFSFVGVTIICAVWLSRLANKRLVS